MLTLAVLQTATTKLSLKEAAVPVYTMGLIGRPGVGKSGFINRVVGHRIVVSQGASAAGVTRLATRISHGPVLCRIVHVSKQEYTTRCRDLTDMELASWEAEQKSGKGQPRPEPKPYSCNVDLANKLLDNCPKTTDVKYNGDAKDLAAAANWAREEVTRLEQSLFGPSDDDHTKTTKLLAVDFLEIQFPWQSEETLKTGKLVLLDVRFALARCCAC